MPCNTVDVTLRKGEQLIPHNRVAGMPCGQGAPQLYDAAQVLVDCVLGHMEARTMTVAALVVAIRQLLPAMGMADMSWWLAQYAYGHLPLIRDLGAWPDSPNGPPYVPSDFPANVTTDPVATVPPTGEGPVVPMVPRSPGSDSVATSFSPRPTRANRRDRGARSKSALAAAERRCRKRLAGMGISSRAATSSSTGNAERAPMSAAGTTPARAAVRNGKALSLFARARRFSGRYPR